MKTALLNFTRKSTVPTAIEQLGEILQEGPSFPKGKLEKMNFVAEYFLMKFKEFLSPDSDLYRSNINPVFSFEFEMKSQIFLSQLKVFSLRDGVLPLMHFFAINQIPDINSPLIIIDSKLSSLVPDVWRSKVILRTPFINSPRKNSNKIILFLSCDPLSMPLEILAIELERLQNELIGHEEVYLFFSSMRIRGEGDAIYDHAWTQKCLLNIMEKIKDCKIHIISFRDYLKMDISFYSFMIVNPLSYYFTDSYLFHDASQRGAICLGCNLRPSNLPLLNLSINHGFYFHQNFSAYRAEAHEKVLRVLFNNISSYAQSKLAIENKFYPKDFMDWSHDVALELYKDCHKNV